MSSVTEPDDVEPTVTDPPDKVTGTPAERRRRRAAVFGEVLPESTSDERADGWSERDGSGDSDEWLRGQVPPHHG